MNPAREGYVATMLDSVDGAVTLTSVAARVMADARRSFAADVDLAILEHETHDVVSRLWTESTKVTTFIPVLALRDLRERLGNGIE
jgi:uncharacterized protein (DUF952 family)